MNRGSQVYANRLDFPSSTLSFSKAAFAKSFKTGSKDLEEKGASALRVQGCRGVDGRGQSILKECPGQRP